MTMTGRAEKIRVAMCCTKDWDPEEWGQRLAQLHTAVTDYFGLKDGSIYFHGGAPTLEALEQHMKDCAEALKSPDNPRAPCCAGGACKV
jgi:hypothetical protein